MRADRFAAFACEVMMSAGHPDIVSVEPYEAPGVAMNPAGIQVKTKDGAVHRLRLTRTSGPGGDNFAEPEQIPYPDYRLPVEASHERVLRLQRDS